MLTEHTLQPPSRFPGPADKVHLVCLPQALQFFRKAADRSSAFSGAASPCREHGTAEADSKPRSGLRIHALAAGICAEQPKVHEGELRQACQDALSIEIKRCRFRQDAVLSQLFFPALLYLVERGVCLLPMSSGSTATPMVESGR